MHAIKIDFTQRHPGFSYISAFGKEYIGLIRESANSKAVVIIDRGFALPKPEPYVVSDHINLAGDNPLVGPNHPAGERFPVVQGVYLTDCLAGVSAGIAAGLKPGVVPDTAEIELIRSLGADFYCYNLVPAMLIAAHAGFKVLALVVPEKMLLSSKILEQISNLCR